MANFDTHLAGHSQRACVRSSLLVPVLALTGDVSDRFEVGVMVQHGEILASCPVCQVPRRVSVLLCISALESLTCVARSSRRSLYRTAAELGVSTALSNSASANVMASAMVMSEPGQSGCVRSRRGHLVEDDVQ